MDTRYIIALAGFVVGAASGVAGTYLYFKKQHEEKLAEEVASLKEAYGRSDSSKKTIDDIVDERTKRELQDEAIKQVKKLADNLGYSGDDISSPVIPNNDYTGYFEGKDSIDEFPEDDPDEYVDLPKTDPSRPRVITDEEYYDEADMEKIEINLFENGSDYVITDSSWEPLEEPFKVITKADLEVFIEQHDEDEIYTVCDARHCMYSIMKQGQSWDEFLKNNPVIIETRY